MGRLAHLSLAFGFALLAMILGQPTQASAQAPDVRNVRPVVMLMVDTSGSMEKKGSCACATPACTECLPVCASAEQNRWATVLQALTGGFNGFSCTTQTRNTALYAAQYDFGYYLPHIALGWSSQSNDGVLDVYRDRVRFGLMTFDGVGTFTDAPPIVPATVFRSRLSDSAAAFGNFSYGTPQPFTFPGCGVQRMMDNGARNENLAAPGRLISVGTDADDQTVINQEIQSALLDPSLRPFGATPVAGMLDDLRYYLDNHPDVKPVRAVGDTGDPYAACRSRYAILLTDGYPNADMRGAPYKCETVGSTCPYPTPEDTARNLCAYSSATSTCGGKIDGLYVVGFNVAGDAAVTARLNALADAGGTGTAFFANDRASLISAMSTVLDRSAPGTTTRTVPALANATVAGSTAVAQLQFNTGFNLPIRDGNPWTGVLERRRIECRLGVPTPQPIIARDRFGVLLNTQTVPDANPGTNRRLLTVRARRHEDSSKWLVGDGETFMSGAGLPVPSAAGIKQRNLSLVRLTASNTSLDRSYFDVPNDTERRNLINWLWGAPGTTRENAKMGDIYHSSPAVNAPPATDLADESYNAFRQDEDVQNRPRMIYVGTNDGIMHAFVADDHRFNGGRYNGQSLSGGTELWGFVPPALLEKLKTARAGHQWMVDGSPLVREVYVARTPNRVRADEWRTILVGTLRGGGRQAFALDVTDPRDPKFLWQFEDERMGNSYSEPAMVQMLVETNGVVNERAVVILGGGEGERQPGACATTGIASARDVSNTPVPGRTMRRCWKNGDHSGRSLFFIDAYTGRLIKKFDREFTAPVTGGVSAFTGDTASVASRAFFTDADGVIWRVDFSNPDPRSWTVKAFFDMFNGMPANAGQPAYPPPVVTTNANQEVVVLQATGDVDKLDESLVRNRVVSVTEKLTFNTATGGVSRVEAYENWQIDLDPGEQVTGPLELFNGNLYFGSFVSISNELDACQFGSSRLWGVKFEEEGGTLNPVGALETSVGSGTYVTYLDDTRIPALNNRILMGVAVAQRPSCFDGSDGSEIDPYLGARPTHRLTTAGQARFELVAQISGGTGGASGGSVGEFTRQLPAPVAYTRPQGYAGTVE
ncbi:MAG: hypothetical protein GXP55_18495 [Deltaproteobacteria bacterium]|nr:hypothetical protein [Deltaproteobacteria bacterium]